MSSRVRRSVRAVFGSSRLKLVIVGLGASLVLLEGGIGAVASQPCKKVSGTFTLAAVSGSDCLSPVGVCARGEYKGSIKGASFFTASDLVTTADTPTTGVVLMTGDNVITTDDGVVTTRDAVVLRTSGDGEFSEVDTVVAGTGAWAGFSGVLTGTGTFTMAGGGSGEYAGHVCGP